MEARPKGRPAGTANEDYVVEEEGDRVLKAFKTQEEAIDWAKSEGHSPHVARVRNPHSHRDVPIDSRTKRLRLFFSRAIYCESSTLAYQRRPAHPLTFGENRSAFVRLRVSPFIGHIFGKIRPEYP
jgi:hypothetical protein